MNYIKARGFLLERNSKITIKIIFDSFKEICKLFNQDIDNVQFRKEDEEYSIYISENLNNLHINHEFNIDFLRTKLISIRQDIFYKISKDNADLGVLYHDIVSYETYQIITFEKYKSLIIEDSNDFEFIKIFFFINNFRSLFSGFITKYPDKKYFFVQSFLDNVSIIEKCDDYLSNNLNDADFIKYIFNEEDFILWVVFAYLKLHNFNIADDYE